MREFVRLIASRTLSDRQRKVIKLLFARLKITLLKLNGSYSKFAQYEAEVQMLRAQVMHLNGILNPPRLPEPGEKDRFHLVKG